MNADKGGAFINNKYNIFTGFNVNDTSELELFLSSIYSSYLSFFIAINGYS